MDNMYIRFTIINDSDLKKRREIQFLIDTGSVRAWIPGEVAAKLDIRPVGQIPLELANGKITEYPYGLCKFEYKGELINGTVIIGPEGAEPIAGTHVLQDFRLIVDMSHHIIRRARAMRSHVHKE